MVEELGQHVCVPCLIQQNKFFYIVQIAQCTSYYFIVVKKFKKTKYEGEERRVECSLF